MQGTIKRLKKESGFGFIRPEGTDGKEDHFFHRSGMHQNSPAFDALSEGQKVVFDIEPSPKGPRATNIRVL